MTPIGPDNPLLTVRDVTRVLPYTEETVRLMLRKNMFPNAVKPGRKWLVPQSDLTDYLNETYGNKETKS